MLNKMIATQLANKYRKEIVAFLGTSDVALVHMDYGVPGINGAFFGAYPLMDMTMQFGNPVASIDSRFLDLKHRKMMKRTIVHEYRHVWQSENELEAFIMEDAEASLLGVEGLDHENATLYSWKEVDARAFEYWYTTGRKGAYVMPKTDAQLWEEVKEDGFGRPDEQFVQLIIERYEAHAKLEYETFGDDEAIATMVAEQKTIIQEQRTAAVVY